MHNNGDSQGMLNIDSFACIDILTINARQAAPFAETKIKKSFACTKFLVACRNASRAVYARYVSLVLPRDHVHETGPVAALAIRAFRYSCRVHPEPERYRADPAEQHLHEPRGTDEFAQHVPDKDGRDDHVDRNTDNAGLDAEGEIPGPDLVPDGLGRDKKTRESYAIDQWDHDNAQKRKDPVLDSVLQRHIGIARLFPVQASPAEELERQKVSKLEERAFGTEPAAKEPSCQESEEREQGENEDPGEDGLQEELDSDMERAGRTLVSIEPLLQAKAPAVAEDDQIMGIRVIPEDIQRRHEEDEEDE